MNLGKRETNPSRPKKYKSAKKWRKLCFLVIFNYKLVLHSSSFCIRCKKEVHKYLKVGSPRLEKNHNF